MSPFICKIKPSTVFINNPIYKFIENLFCIVIDKDFLQDQITLVTIKLIKLKRKLKLKHKKKKIAMKRKNQ